ncbi:MULTISPECIES: hypothetical protein [unclassified Caballeronia]|uniref:hypothetical protein n=1 Tax=unclassified Caballeronia TaxID=2646786 RepID=UPI001F1CFB4F|nr:MULTISPECIES: hypothetical protein [unclassified Caballeronia]MCE4545918.1 hypothetical protein [Caballeronia sp. PC1]MCE4571960.1 hypothetical protein [Caballeronia sp. CLC5]
MATPREWMMRLSAVAPKSILRITPDSGLKSFVVRSEDWRAIAGCPLSKVCGPPGGKIADSLAEIVSVFSAGQYDHPHQKTTLFARLAVRAKVGMRQESERRF